MLVRVIAPFVVSILIRSNAEHFGGVSRIGTTATIGSDARNLFAHEEERAGLTAI